MFSQPINLSSVPLADCLDELALIQCGITYQEGKRWHTDEYGQKHNTWFIHQKSSMSWQENF